MSRYLIALFVLITIGLFAVASAAPHSCTRVGTPRRDIMAGGHGRDVLCGIGGNDYLAGDGAHDVLRGGAGRDTLVGGTGKDRALGGPGDDRIFMVDGRGGGVADGGAGFDSCYVDPQDSTRNCEVVSVGANMQTTRHLTSAFHGGLATAEELISEAPEVTVTETVTRTITASFPPCTPPPADPPTPC